MAISGFVGYAQSDNKSRYLLIAGMAGALCLIGSTITVNLVRKRIKYALTKDCMLSQGDVSNPIHTDKAEITNY